MHPHRILLSTALAFALSLSAVPWAFAQPALPTLAPPPQAEGDDDMEVYTRGTLHEAFATPASNDVIVPPVVQKSPPPLIEELPPEQQPEGDDVTWIAGYWGWDEDLDDYVWISGLWRDIPPGRQWVPGYWAQTPDGHQWVAGMWVAEGPTTLTYLPNPPESLERGPSIDAPSADYFYVPGCWEFRDTRYAWRTGYWAPRQRDWIWVSARYVHTPYGCCFVPGHWDYALVDRGLCYAPVRFHHARPVVYRPVIVIDTWDSLVMHLWVDPRRGCYTYGNYYDAPRTRCVPWYEYRGPSGRGDHLFAYYEWRNGPDYRHRLHGWHDHFASHRDWRPPATYREQARYVESRRSTTNINLSLAIDITKIDRDRDRDNHARLPVAIKPVSREDNNRYHEQAKAWAVAAQKRRQFEAEPVGRGDNNARPDRMPEPRRVTLDVPKAVAAVEKKDIQRPDSPDKLKDVTPDKPRGDAARVPVRTKGNRPEVAKTDRDPATRLPADLPPPPPGGDADSKPTAKDDRKDKNPRDAFGIGQDEPGKPDRGDMPDRRPGQGKAQTDPVNPRPDAGDPVPGRPREDAGKSPVGRPRTGDDKPADRSKEDAPGRAPRDNDKPDMRRPDDSKPGNRIPERPDRPDAGKAADNPPQPNVPKRDATPNTTGDRGRMDDRGKPGTPADNRPRIESPGTLPRRTDGKPPAAGSTPVNPPSDRKDTKGADRNSDRPGQAPSTNRSPARVPEPNRPQAGTTPGRKADPTPPSPNRDSGRTEPNRRTPQPRPNPQPSKADDKGSRPRPSAPDRSKGGKPDDKDKDKEKDKDRKPKAPSA